MVANINWLITKAPAKLGDVSDCRVIEAPKGVFVECLNAFDQANFDTVCQEVILPEQILLLNTSEQLRVSAFAN